MSYYTSGTFGLTAIGIRESGAVGFLLLKFILQGLPISERQNYASAGDLGAQYSKSSVVFQTPLIPDRFFIFLTTSRLNLLRRL